MTCLKLFLICMFNDANLAEKFTNLAEFFLKKWTQRSSWSLFFSKSVSRLMSARNAVKFWRTFVMLTTSNQFESHIFWSNFLKLVVAAQDYDILHTSHFPEIPGWLKCTFSSSQIFKLTSGEPKVIQLVTWYHVSFLGQWTIYFLFQNTRKIIRLSLTKLQTHLTPPPLAGS